MTFDFESLSAKVGPLLRIDLSQEGHGEKNISEIFPKICFFSSKNVGFCQKVLPEKVFPASRPPKFLSHRKPGDEKKIGKKICQKVKNIFKSVAAIRQVFLKSLFFVQDNEKYFFSKWQKPSEDIKLEKQLFLFFCKFFIFAKTRSVF